MTCLARPNAWLAALLFAAAPAHAEPASPPPAPAAAPKSAAAALKAPTPEPPTATPTVQPLAHSLADTRRLLAAVPTLSPLATEFAPFETADIDAALRRGARSRESITVWAFQPAAFSWKPALGREFWVLSGRAGKRALLAVMERRADGHLEHAASAILDEPDTSIAVGFAAGSPGELLWTSCYGCAGEGGGIRLRPDGRVEIVFR